MKKFERSEEFLARAQRVIPLGSQTFSKSKTQYPHGVSPFFITRGEGSRVWDLDGNEYIDYVSSLASITLGYQDADVTAAVQAQLMSGVIFSLPHPIETEVAEMICDMVPCAEMVRFGKNGSDATAGAIRLSRAYTQRDHVAVCGYHGWQDWYIGTTARHRGVPEAVRDLSHTFAFNDIASLQGVFDRHPGQVAAVILEPMNVTLPAAGFLEAVRDLTHQHGALLVFDETITGFRFANGGAQELFGVTPDLATFGKGLANGYPVSAIAGRREVMQLMEEIFFSFTFGGETLSLAAAKATLTKLLNEPVVQTISERGTRLAAALQALLQHHGLQDIASVSGHPSWTFLTWRDTPAANVFEFKTLVLQEMIERGILTLGTHNLSYAHTDADIDALLAAYDGSLGVVAGALRNGDVRGALRTEPLQPLFRVR